MKEKEFRISSDNHEQYDLWILKILYNFSRFNMMIMISFLKNIFQNTRQSHEHNDFTSLRQLYSFTWFSRDNERHDLSLILVLCMISQIPVVNIVNICTYKYFKAQTTQSHFHDSIFHMQCSWWSRIMHSHQLLTRLLRYFNSWILTCSMYVGTNLRKSYNFQAVIYLREKKHCWILLITQWK